MAETGDEPELIRASLAGDQAAYAVLVARYQRMVHALTFRMTGSLQDAEDLAQEAFIQAYHQLHTFRGGAKFSTWLCRIAMNGCLNWRNRESRRAGIHNRWVNENLTYDPASPTATDFQEIDRRVQSALNRLPVQQRAAVVMTVYEDMSHAEAARALGCSETTISWRIFVARKKLKRWLKSKVQADE